MSVTLTPMARLTAAIPSRLLRRIFIASVAFNLLFIGFSIGDALFIGPHKGPRAVEMALGPIARALTDEDRKAILHSLDGNPALQPFGHGDHATDVRALIAALQIVPFDPLKVRDAIEAQTAKVSQAQQAVQGAVLDRLANMSAEERTDFVARLQDDD